MDSGYSLGSIIVKLKADSTQLNAELAGASQKVGAFGASLTKLAIPILAATGYAAKMAISFQQQMTYVRTQAGDTEDNLNNLSNSVLNLAKASQYGPDELAKGLFHLASLGLRGAEAMKALDTAQRLAAVGGATLEETTSAVGAAMVTGIQGTQDLNETAGILNATIGAGNMKMQDLIGALGTGILPAFKNAGLSLKEFGAALATLTDNGMDASNAATRLRMTIGLIEAPSGTATKALEAIGLTSSSLGVTMQKEGLIPTLQLLRDSLLKTYGVTDEGKQKMAEALSLMFGGGRSSSAIETLLDQIPRVQNKLQQIGDQAGGFANAYAQQQETASARIKTAWSTIQADAIQLGGKVLPPLTEAFTKLVGVIDSLFNWYQRLSPAWRTVVNTAIAFLAVAGPTLLIFVKIISMVRTLAFAFGVLRGAIIAIDMAMLLNPWVLAIMAVIAATILIVTHWNTVKKWFGDFIHWLGSHLPLVLGILFGPFGVVVGMIINHWNSILSFFRNLPGNILNALGNLGGLLYQAGRDLLQGLINGVTSRISAVINTVRNAVSSAVNAVKGFLGIHSPSTVFAEIGRNMAAGMSLGITQGMGGVMQASAKMAAGATVSTTISGPINIGSQQDADYLLSRLNRNNYLATRGVSPQ